MRPENHNFKPTYALITKMSFIIFQYKKILYETFKYFCLTSEFKGKLSPNKLTTGDERSDVHATLTSSFQYYVSLSTSSITPDTFC